jgi:hypothetical protein
MEEPHIGTHFSEILTKRLDWDLVNNAYRGCSNGGVRLQIAEVIKQKPDFAIIIPTFFDRTEIPVTALKPDYDNIGWADFDRIMQKYSGYDPSQGIENINYGNSTAPTLICENYNSLVHEWVHPYRKKHPISKEATQAIKDFVSYLYDANWKKQQDQWIIEHGCLELVQHNIPFVMIPTLSLWQNEGPKLLDTKYYTLDANLYCPCFNGGKPEFSFGDYRTEHNKDPGYHTNYAGQIYLADQYQNLMKERWGLQ